MKKNLYINYFILKYKKLIYKKPNYKNNIDIYKCDYKIFDI
jgi:hypothetical protein